MGEVDESFFTEGRIGLDDFFLPGRLEEICASERELYWTIDWSTEFYIAQAKAGFIATSIELDFEEPVRILLPEIQHAYAVLDWENLHVSRSMRRWMNRAACEDGAFELRVGIDFREVLKGIAKSHPDNWMDGCYHDLLGKLAAQEWDGFELLPVGMFDGVGKLVAGEMGIRTGKVYTSLTGFMDRSDPDLANVGKLQLFRLGEWLRDEGFAFWNLGHPYMQYKIDLGGRVVKRNEYLARFRGEGRAL
ncbi:MAG: Leu/Phe-tRNA-protein transferase [Pseudoalteromonas tetraodonis]|jgi:Leu/Phe-tRNA-protein transferase